EKVRRYVPPAGTVPKVYSPLLPEVAVRLEPVRVSSSVAVTPASGAPVASVTRPRIEAVSAVCATAPVVKQSRIRARTNVRMGCSPDRNGSRRGVARGGAARGDRRKSERRTLLKIEATAGEEHIAPRTRHRDARAAERSGEDELLPRCHGA